MGKHLQVSIWPLAFDQAKAENRSNSNGTYYGLSVEHVNRNTAGYVDFEKVCRY